MTGNIVVEHPADLDDEKLLRFCRETRTRRGGPGGQHRNKVETAIVLLHEPTGITAEASERRSQAENRRVALLRLRLNLAIECRVVRNKAPSPRWQKRVQHGRLAISVDHQEYAPLVAEAFDHLVTCDGDMRRAAETLHVTPTQLTNLFRKDNSVWSALQKDRSDRGLRSFK